MTIKDDRAGDFKVTLTDEVDQVMKVLLDDPNFWEMIKAHKDDDVAGNAAIDAVMAAQMIRKKGIEMNRQLISEASLNTISTVLRRVVSRYSADRS